MSQDRVGQRVSVTKQQLAEPMRLVLVVVLEAEAVEIIVDGCHVVGLTRVSYCPPVQKTLLTPSISPTCLYVYPFC